MKLPQPLAFTAANVSPHGHPIFPSAALVGRSSELIWLEEHLRHATNGAGRIALIVGEPGIGKTRLATEVLALARDRRMLVLTGRYQSGAENPLGPWAEVLHDLVRSLSDEDLARIFSDRPDDLLDLVPVLRDRLTPRGAESVSENVMARRRLAEAITGALRRAAGSRPVLLFFDDLQWADEASLLLLLAIDEVIESAPLLVLGTFRTDTVKSDVRAAPSLGALWRNPRIQRISLPRFSPAETGEMLAALAAGEVAAELTGAVHLLTAGHPLHVRELWRHLAEKGAVRQANGDTWTSIASSPTEESPLGMQATINRRLERLSLPCRELLQLLAVHGADASPDLLERAAHLPAGGAAPLLAEAVDARIIEQPTAHPPRYRFTHSLHGEALRSGLTSARLGDTHRRIAEALESLPFDDATEHIARIAHHSLEADASISDESAVEWALLASRYALARYAFDSAAQLLEKALVRLGDHPQRRSRYCEILLTLGDAQLQSGHMDISHATFVRAAELAREIGDANSSARAAIGLTNHYHPQYFRRGDLPIRLLEEALAAIPFESAPLRALLLSYLARALCNLPDAAVRRRETATEAMLLARSVGDARALAHVLEQVQWALWDPEHVQHRIAAAQEMFDMSHRLGDAEIELKSRAWQLLAAAEDGNIRDFHAGLPVYVALAERLGHPRHRMFASRFASVSEMLRGNLDHAERYAWEARAAAQRVDPAMGNLYFVTQLIGIRRLQDRLPELAPIGDATTREWETGSIPWALPLILGTAGRADEARDLLRHLVRSEYNKLFVEGPSGWLGVSTLLADASCLLGEVDIARQIYERLRPFSGRWVIVLNLASCFGPVDRALGRLAAFLGDTVGSRIYFERAARTCIEANAWAELRVVERERMDGTRAGC